MKTNVHLFSSILIALLMIACLPDVQGDILTHKEMLAREKANTEQRSYVLFINADEHKDKNFQNMIKKECALLKQSFVLSGVAPNNMIVMAPDATAPYLRPTRKNILNMLDSLSNLASSNDTILIFLSAPSVLYKEDLVFQMLPPIFPKNAQTDISASELARILASSRSKKTYLFLNSTRDYSLKGLCANSVPLPVKEYMEVAGSPDQVVTMVLALENQKLTKSMVRLAHLFMANVHTLQDPKLYLDYKGAYGSGNPFIFYILKDDMIQKPNTKTEIKPNISVVPKKPQEKPSPAVPVTRPEKKPAKPIQKNNAEKAKKSTDSKSSSVHIPGNRHLLSLGIRKYEDKKFPILRGDMECENVRQAFVHYCKVDLQDSICLSDSFVNKYHMKNLLCSFLPPRMHSGDTFFIYLNGHFCLEKQPGGSSEFMFIPSDASYDKRAETSLKMSELASWLKKYYSQCSILLILDASKHFPLLEKDKLTLQACFAGLDRFAVIFPTCTKATSSKSQGSTLSQVLCSTIRKGQPATSDQLFHKIKREYESRLQKDSGNKTDKLFILNKGGEKLEVVPRQKAAATK